MIRRLVLAIFVCAAVGIFGAQGHIPAPIAYAVPAIANNCGDPAHTSAVSLWSYSASNGTSGQFTMVQSDIGDSSAAGVALSANLDTVTIDNVLSTDFGGQLMALGNTIFIIAKSPDGTFMVSIIDKTGPAQISILTIGGPTFFSIINASLVTGGCYANLVINPSMEASTNNNTNVLGWSPSGSNAVWLRSFNGANLDRFTGQGALQTAETQSPCNTISDDSYWTATDYISVSSGVNYVMGAYEHSTNAAATGTVNLDLYVNFIFPIYVGTVQVSSRASTSWGLSFGAISFPDGVSLVKPHLGTDINSCSSSPVTRFANFDDVFLINTGSGPAPAFVH